MPFRNALPVIVSTLLALVSPATAGGEIVITQAKALAGAVTPGDTPGYPVTLSQPGAYMLESNLTVTPGTYGLFVTANNVDIDMNGFTLSGNGGGTYGLISGFGESSIHGGVINRFRNSGIYLRNNAWTIEDMKIVRNGGMGIDATDSGYITVRRSLVVANVLRGISAGLNLSVYVSTFSKNGGIGIICTHVCHVNDSVISDNSEHGIVMYSGFVSGNTIFNNKVDGIFDLSGAKDSGMADNMLANNNNGSSQTTFAVDVHPNTCVGKPCSVP